MTASRSSSLAGKKIVVTRAAHQADELDDLLRSRGALPLAYPCIAIAPPADAGPLDAAVRGLAAGDVDWLVLTSRNVVTVLAERLRALALEMPQPLLVAAVGASTAEAAERELGLRADLVPAEFVTDALSAALAERLQPGQRVLLCQADIARPLLAEELSLAGADVAVVVAYRTVPGSGGVDLPALLAERQVDAITCTSSSTVRNLVRRVQAEGGTLADLSGVCLACLGPIAAGTAREFDLAVQVVPEEYTLPGLVHALELYFERKSDDC